MTDQDRFTKNDASTNQTSEYCMGENNGDQLYWNHSQLDPVLYTEDRLEDLIGLLKLDSTDASVSLSATIGNEQISFDSVSELVDSPRISVPIGKISVRLEADEGSADFLIDQSKRAHLLMVRGERYWARGKEDDIHDFTSQYRSSRIRKYINEIGKTRIQIFLTIALVFMDIRYFWPVLGVPFHKPMPMGVQILSIFLLATIGGLEIYDRIYPYVTVVSDLDDLLYRRIASRVVEVATLISAIGVIWKIGRIVVFGS